MVKEEPVMVARIKIKRELKTLYYVKADENGWLCIYKRSLGLKMPKVDINNGGL